MMAKVHFNRLKTNATTFKKIPPLYKEEVLEMGKQEVRDNKMPVSQFEKLFGITWEE